jgi:hypothetical protein
MALFEHIDGVLPAQDTDALGLVGAGWGKLDSAGRKYAGPEGLYKIDVELRRAPMSS